MFHVELGNLEGAALFHVEQRQLSVLLRRSKSARHATIRAPVISLDRYAKLLAQPGIRPLIAVSMLGRLPIGITGLAILLLAQRASGSFAQGGTTAACYVAGLATLAPLLGRQIDRYGPRPMLLVCAFAFPAALLALVLAFHWQAAMGLAYTFAYAAGATFPPITVCMRTFFRQQLKDETMLATAYSLESVLIEAIFMVGPMLVGLLVAVASPAAAVIAAAACGFAGTLLFQRSRALKCWRIEARRAASLFGPLAEPGFVRLLAIVLCYASAFGLVEIGLTAYATEAGNPALAGVLLGVMSVGSIPGGLIYGSRSWHLPLQRQFSLTLIVMGLGIAPLMFQWSIWSFGLSCIVAGIVMSPALIMQSIMVARIARSEHATEAFTWSATGLLAGVGLGLTGGGLLLEFARSPAAFGAATVVSCVAGLFALRLMRLRD